MKIKTTFFLHLAIPFILLCLGGCQTAKDHEGSALTLAPAPAPVKHQERFYKAMAPNLKEHVWQFLKKEQVVDDGYGLYTYVLTGRNISDTNATGRYSKLVSLIQSSTTSKTDLPSDIDESQLNTFLIPAKGAPGEERADQELSMTLLFKIALGSGKDFSGPGPFLFSIHQPIRSGKSNSLVNILYADLSSVHEKAFAELVRAYKERVTGSAISGTEKLSSFRISLLNTALIAEDSIGFIKTAEASFRDTFSPQ